MEASSGDIAGSAGEGGGFLENDPPIKKKKRLEEIQNTKEDFKSRERISPTPTEFPGKRRVRVPPQVCQVLLKLASCFVRGSIHHIPKRTLF